MLGTALQPVPVLQVGVVAFGDPLGAVAETPAAAGNHCCAVTVAWKDRRRHKSHDEAELHSVLRYFKLAS